MLIDDDDDVAPTQRWTVKSDDYNLDSGYYVIDGEYGVWSDYRWWRSEADDIVAALNSGWRPSSESTSSPTAPWQQMLVSARQWLTQIQIIKNGWAPNADR